MLSDYPIFFDETELKIKRTRWTRSYENLSNVNETEAGTDNEEVLRKGKAVIGAEFVCSDRWAAILTAFNDKLSIQVKFYDIKSRQYVTLKMRMNGLNVNEIEDSERVPNTNGLYIVSFDLVEF